MMFCITDDLPWMNGVPSKDATLKSTFTQKRSTDATGPTIREADEPRKGHPTSDDEQGVTSGLQVRHSAAGQFEKAGWHWRNPPEVREMIRALTDFRMSAFELLLPCSMRNRR